MSGRPRLVSCIAPRRGVALHEADGSDPAAGVSRMIVMVLLLALTAAAPRRRCRRFAGGPDGDGRCRSSCSMRRTGAALSAGRVDGIGMRISFSMSRMKRRLFAVAQRDGDTFRAARAVLPMRCT